MVFMFFVRKIVRKIKPANWLAIDRLVPTSGNVVLASKIGREAGSGQAQKYWLSSGAHGAAWSFDFLFAVWFYAGDAAFCGGG
jgi:hypothetical protein